MGQGGGETQRAATNGHLSRDTAAGPASEAARLDASLRCTDRPQRAMASSRAARDARRRWSRDGQGHGRRLHAEPACEVVCARASRAREYSEGSVERHDSDPFRGPERRVRGAKQWRAAQTDRSTGHEHGHAKPAVTLAQKLPQSVRNLQKAEIPRRAQVRSEQARGSGSKPAHGKRELESPPMEASFHSSTSTPHR
jgi:hypothetical protein